MKTWKCTLALIAALAVGCDAGTDDAVATGDTGATADAADTTTGPGVDAMSDAGPGADALADAGGQPGADATGDTGAPLDDATIPTGDTGTPTGDAGTPVEDTADAGGPADSAEPMDGADGGFVCEGETPLCAPSCGGDSFYGEATCKDGAWFCEEGIPTSDCPPGSCFGEKYPGEICTDQGWACAPEAAVLAECPAVMCLTCAGWDNAAVFPTEGCACTCQDGAVLCTKGGADTCNGQSESTLPGVSITVDATDCVFTLAEAAAGISIPYTITIASAVEGAFSLPQDSGQCEQPGASGLIPFERLAGNDQHWCICDTGLCQGPDETPTTFDAGSWTQTFEWDGKNFDGPSDTGFVPGDPFPPGDYTLTISAKGKTVAVDAMTPFEVKATATIHLIP